MSNTTRIIDNDDYNFIRDRIIAVMGTGNVNPDTESVDPTFGYGQTIISSVINEGDIITKEQWDALRFDILNARIHQDGSTPSIIEPSKGQAIKYGSGSPNNQYNLQTTTAINNRLSLGSGQFTIDAASDGASPVVTPVSPVVRSLPWTNQVSCIITVTFNDIDHSRYFFNSGGKIRFSSSRTGGASSLQNSNWTALLSSVGSIDFGATSTVSGAPNFYNLTSSYQTLINRSGSATYSGNNYLIQVRRNNPIQIQFFVQWTDNYIDTSPATPPFDVVDGVLELEVNEIRASGTLLPLAADAVRLGISTPGNFTIDRPVFVISSIGGS